MSKMLLMKGKISVNNFPGRIKILCYLRNIILNKEMSNLTAKQET